MSEQLILDTAEVATLERLIEEATRSSEEGVRRFIEPAIGTLGRATSRQHHLVFGRRGSGKSSLLRKAAADLTVDRRPIAFVDLETFKGHAYPDVLLSILIKTFSEFAEWLETAAIAPASKTTFWSRLFGARPTRSPFDKNVAKAQAGELRSAVSELRTLLFSEDGVSVEAKKSNKTTDKDSLEADAGVGITGAKAGAKGKLENAIESAQDVTEKYTTSKL